MTVHHTVTLPDGHVATRNSKTRIYTHAVAVKRDADAEWGVYRFSASHENAAKAVDEVRRIFTGEHAVEGVRILDVEHTGSLAAKSDAPKCPGRKTGEYRAYGRGWQFKCDTCGEFVRYVKSRKAIVEHDAPTA